MSAYTEDRLVEQPGIGLFAELGWQTVSAREEKFGPRGVLGHLGDRSNVYSEAA